MPARVPNQIISKLIHDECVYEDTGVIRGCVYYVNFSLLCKIPSCDRLIKLVIHIPFIKCGDN